MNIRLVTRILGGLLMLEAALLLLPLPVALIYGENTAHAFLFPALGAGLLGLAFARMGRGAHKGLYAREGFLIAGMSWILLSLVGAFPFWIDGSIPRFMDCLFESISGFTTTSATILPRVEALPNSLLFWRSFTNWVGGMGVLILFLALLPAMGESSIQLMRAEAPGPSIAKLSPKMGETARFLYLAYLILTAAALLALRIAGMPWFDSVTHAFSAAASGGFSIKTESILFYNNPAVNGIVTVITFLSGLNFTVYFLLVARRFKEIRSFSEAKLYLGVAVGASALLTFILRGQYGSMAVSAGHAAFQTVSMMTTAGFTVDDYTLWPASAQMVLMLLMSVGACSLGTSGGLKLSRLMLIAKGTVREFKRLMRPRLVSVVRVNRTAVPEHVMRPVFVYFFCYVSLIFVGTLIVSFDRTDLLSAFTAVLASASNTGSGLGQAGPGGSFAGFSALSKGVFSLSMLMGRLEMFPILALMMPSTWRK